VRVYITYIRNITSEIWTPEDIAKYGDWTSVPCRAGEARFTLPTISHGAEPTTCLRRRTILPWFIGLQDDLESLELVESGNWTMLSQSHRSLTSMGLSATGWSSIYGTTPYRFPAAVELDGIGALSSALVCRRSWASPSVLADRDLLLGSNIQDIRKYVEYWRKRAKRLFLRAFSQLENAKKRVFGEVSVGRFRYLP